MAIQSRVNPSMPQMGNCLHHQTCNVALMPSPQPSSHSHCTHKWSLSLPPQLAPARTKTNPKTPQVFIMVDVCWVCAHLPWGAQEDRVSDHLCPTTACQLEGEHKCTCHCSVGLFSNSTQTLLNSRHCHQWAQIAQL